MKRGILRGFRRSSREKRLVYISLGGGCWVGAITADPVVLGTTDVATSLSNPCNGKFSENGTHGAVGDPMRPCIPAQGVVGLSLTLIGVNTSAVSQGITVVSDYDDTTNTLGVAGSSGRTAGYLYYGKTIGHYDAAYVPFVRTGGRGGTQFRYLLLAPASGSGSAYIRITGYWLEVDA